MSDPRSPARRRLEEVSRPLLVRISAAPRWAPALGLLVVLLGGLFAPSPIGPLLLVVVAAFLTWLLALAWPRLPVQARVVRVLVVLLLVVMIVLEVTGRTTGVF